MTKIFRVPIGTINRDILRKIGEALKKMFHCNIKIANEVSIPKHAYNMNRR